MAYPCLGDNVWYFFTPRDRKRVYRLCANGYWKCYGTKQKIYHDNIRIGYKNSLIFYVGEPPYGRETIWVMKEYIAERPPRLIRDDDTGDIEVKTISTWFCVTLMLMFSVMYIYWCYKIVHSFPTLAGRLRFVSNSEENRPSPAFKN